MNIKQWLECLDWQKNNPPKKVDINSQEFWDSVRAKKASYLARIG